MAIVLINNGMGNQAAKNKTAATTNGRNIQGVQKRGKWRTIDKQLGDVREICWIGQGA